MAFMVFMISTFSIKIPEIHAIGVVGSSALKQAVIGSWEKAGVKFKSVDAKEKAFDRWQMKTYEKWQADEAAGRNSDLWANYNAIVQGQVAPFTKNPVAEMPGVSRMLIDTTLFGLAITVGAELGYEFQNAQQNKQYLHNLSLFPPKEMNGVDLLPSTRYRVENADNDPWHQVALYYGDSPGMLHVAYSLVPGEARIMITGIEWIEKSGRWDLTVAYTSRESDGTPSGGTKTISNYSSQDIFVPDPATGGYKYGFMPRPDHVPDIAPAPEIVSEPWHEIPNIIPQPVEVLVPTDDTIWDGTLNEPYVPPVPGDNPDPNKPPGDNPDPDKDPNKPPGDDVDPDKPPGTVPPPDMDKPPVESPEYPGEVTDPEGTPTGGLFSKLFEWLKALLDALYKILNAILAIPSLIINALKALLLALFVPTDGFWDDNVNDIRKVVTDELDAEDLLEEVDNLGGVSGGQFKDVVVSLMGVDNLEVIDADSVNSVLNFIHKFVRGVVFPFLILYNINQLYKLIRGTSLVEATRNLNRMKGE